MGTGRTDLAALAGLAAVLGLAVVVFARGSRAPGPVALTTPPPAAPVRVHVAGEVSWPGVYVLPAGSRVQDAILAAHGPTPLADLRRLNLAAPVRDGDRVAVPRIVQPPGPWEGVRPNPGTAGPDAATAAGEPPPLVNVNTATAAELERLPGIGPVLARRIVEHREASGLFRRLEDLREVKGIGPKLYRRLEPLLRLD